jgi:mRNA interferase MazF
MPNTPNPVVQRGELYWLDWNPARGSEQAGRRPALVIQENPASSNPNYPLTIVAAVSTQGRDIAAHVPLEPSASNGLAAPSFVKCEQIQTVSKTRLMQRIGILDSADMARVETALKKVLSLP